MSTTSGAATTASSVDDAESGSHRQHHTHATYSSHVIGTGQEGAALVRKLVEHGCKVCMANAKDPGNLTELARETGARPLDIGEIAKGADIIFLCIPMCAISELPAGLLKNCPEETIIVDCCNYYPSRDGRIKEIDEGMPESLWVKKQIGGNSSMIKAFNAILASVLQECGRPKGSESRICIPLCGDGSKAKQKIASMIDEMGFEPFDAGDLANSWKIQPGSPAYCTNLKVDQMAKALSAANRDAMPTLRDEAYRKMSSSSSTMDWRALVKMLRETYADPSKQIGLDELIGSGEQMKTA